MSGGRFGDIVRVNFARRGILLAEDAAEHDPARRCSHDVPRNVDAAGLAIVVALLFVREFSNLTRENAS